MSTRHCRPLGPRPRSGSCTAGRASTLSAGFISTTIRPAEARAGCSTSRGRRNPATTPSRPAEPGPGPAQPVVEHARPPGRADEPAVAQQLEADAGLLELLPRPFAPGAGLLELRLRLVECDRG